MFTMHRCALAVLLFSALVPLSLVAQKSGPDKPNPSRPNAANPNPQLAAKPLNARVETLLKKMTLDEKIGQLVQFSAGFATGPNAAAANTRFEDLVAKGQV